MAQVRTIEGKVVFEPIEMGVWGIEGADGKRYEPLQMPEQLKMPGRKVKVKVRLRPDTATVRMWGIPVEIIAFHTLAP